MIRLDISRTYIKPPKKTYGNREGGCRKPKGGIYQQRQGSANYYQKGGRCILRRDIYSPKKSTKSGCGEALNDRKVCYVFFNFFYDVRLCCQKL